MSQPGFSGNQRIVDINADSGAFVEILATSPVRRLVIEESPVKADGTANTLQGALQYRLPNDGTADGFTTVFEKLGANNTATQGEISPAKIELGNPVGQRGAFGELLGNGPGQVVGIGATPATRLIDLRSGTATATSVVIAEYN